MKILNQKSLITLGLALLFQQLSAQQVITGRVTEAGTEKPVQGVTVKVQGTVQGTSTNEHGQFSLKVRALPQKLVFSHVGYASIRKTVLSEQAIYVKMYPDQIKLSETVITASRYRQTRFSSPRTMTVADEQDIRDKNQLSALDVFNNKIGVWIEKRTTTTSDPVIRGLSGANLLALVNGNSFSTFWGEGGFAGDDLYGKIDPESIERIEIIRGPASVMYGSNALGGVINFIPKRSPLDFRDEGFEAGGKLRGAYGSSSNYLMGRVETWGASQKVKYFAGVTTHHSGDMRAGGDVGYIRPSGGKDYAADVSVETKVSANSHFRLTSQYINRPEVYRSYRPAQSNSNLRWALNLGYLSTKQTKLYNSLEFNIYRQYKKDTRTWYTDQSRQTEESTGYAWWETYNAGLQAVKYLGQNNRLLYGMTYQVDIAESPGDEQFTMETSTGEQPASPKTWWHNPGLFTHFEWDVKKWITLSAGLRYDYFYFKAGDETFYTKPGDTDTTTNKALSNPAEYHKNSVTGSLASVFHLTDQLNIATTYSHGFRMFPPTFGFSQTGQGVLVPNGLLDPVTADMFEISPRLQTKVVDAYVAAYYTGFNNFQQPIHGTYNGEDYIDFNNNGTFEPDERVYVNTPNGEAYVTGVEIELSLNMNEIVPGLKGLYLIGGYMYNYGRMKFPGTEEMPLRHTHPERLLVKLRYEDAIFEKSFWAELTGDIVGKFDEVDPGRLMSDVGYLENPQDPLSGLYREYGLPGYEVFHFHSGLRLSQSVYFTLAVENIFDIRYRTAHSRMDASGRNFLFGLDFTF